MDVSGLERQVENIIHVVVLLSLYCHCYCCCTCLYSRWFVSQIIYVDVVAYYHCAIKICNIVSIPNKLNVDNKDGISIVNNINKTVS